MAVRVREVRGKWFEAATEQRDEVRFCGGGVFDVWSIRRGRRSPILGNCGLQSQPAFAPSLPISSISHFKLQMTTISIAACDGKPELPH